MNQAQSPRYQHHHSRVEIIAGSGALDDLAGLIPDPAKVLFITSPGLSERGLSERIESLLSASILESYEQATLNPELEELEVLIHRYRNAGITSIVGLGGGSVIDVAKVLGVTINSEVDHSLDYLLRQGNPQNWTTQVPVVAMFRPSTEGR